MKFRENSTYDIVSPTSMGIRITPNERQPVHLSDVYDRIDAVVFNLLQIGELAKSKLSDSFKKTHNDIPWNDIYGFRNRLVHDYENIILTIVYDAITENLPILTILIDKVLKN